MRLFFAALAACVGAAAAAPPERATEDEMLYKGFVPIGLRVGNNGLDGEVTLCWLRHDLHHEDPAGIAMFRDLIKVSECIDHMNRRSVPLHALVEIAEDKVLAGEVKGDDEFPDPTPAGMVFHEARVGSTLAANLLTSLDGSITYTESTPPMDILLHSSISRETKIRVLRATVAMMSRVPGNKRMFFKFQSVGTTVMDIVTEAFPDTPFVFLHRRPDEVLASMLMTTKDVDGDRAKELERVVARSSPCMRDQARRHIPTFVKELIGSSKDGVLDARMARPPQYCAAHITYLSTAAQDVITGSTNVLKGANGKPNPKGAVLNYLNIGPAFPKFLEHHFKIKPTADEIARLEDTGSKYSKHHAGSTRLGENSAGDWKGDSKAKQDSMSAEHIRYITEYTWPVYEALNKIAAGGKWLTEEQQAELLAQKPPAPPSGRRQLAAAEAEGWNPLEVEEDYAAVGEVTNKLTEIARKLAEVEQWQFPAPESEAVARRRRLGDVPDMGGLTLAPMAGEAGGDHGIVNSGPGAPEGIDPTTWPEGFRNPPLHAPGASVQWGEDGHPPEGYPQTFPLLDVLKGWNVDDPRIPEGYGSFSSLRVFDYATELEEATLWRELEVPFVIRNAHPIQHLVKKWNDEYLIEKFGDRPRFCEYAKGNIFMYYNRGSTKYKRDKSFEPPTQDRYLTFEDWLKKAKAVQEGVLHGGQENTEIEHWYFRVSAPEYKESEHGPNSLRGHKPRPGSMFDNPFITHDTKGFFEHTDSFFIVRPDGQKGVHCRFGQSGIVAMSHYDSGRNSITMERGMKRYILAPPDQCKNLDILQDGPSARHTGTSWGDMEEAKKKLANGRGLEVILQAGDMLYLPALWFHHIISLTTNIQCNSRSGNPPLWGDAIKECGLRPPPSERSYQSTHDHRLAKAQAAFDDKHDDKGI